MARPKKAITKAQIKNEIARKKQFKAKRKTEHFLAQNSDFIEHRLDDDLIECHQTRKPAPGQEMFFGLMDEKLNAAKGTYYFSWNKEQLILLWEGILYRSLGSLRYINEVSALYVELDWICSNHFDAICSFLGLDASFIRIEIPKILETYASPKELATNKYYIGLKEYRQDVLNDAEQVTSRTYNVEEV